MLSDETNRHLFPLVELMLLGPGVFSRDGSCCLPENAGNPTIYHRERKIVLKNAADDTKNCNM
jgi:hypothetical protein